MPIDKEELEKAMTRLCAGDKAALGEVYAIMRKSVYLLSYSILKDAQAAEDVVQETFLRVADNAGKYRAGEGAGTWICVIARNLSYRAYTNSKKTTGIDPAGGVAAVKEEAIWTERMELNDAMLILEPHETEIVTLFSQGYKHREIAEIVQKPVGTVQWLFHESVKKLRKKLGKGEN
jgi:RNA polymerase sigma-70 factor (ECF subfamily)